MDKFKDIIRQTIDAIEQFAAIEQTKLEAAAEANLTALEDCMTKEQAMILRIKDEVAAAKRQGRTFLQGNAGAGDAGAKRGAAASLRQTFQVHQSLSGYQQKRRADYQNQPVCGKPQA